MALRPKRKTHAPRAIYSYWGREREGHRTPKKKQTPPAKPKRLVIGAPAILALPAAELEEEGSEFGDYDYNPLSSCITEVELVEDEDLARA